MSWGLSELAEKSFIMCCFWPPALWAKIFKRKSEIIVAATVEILLCTLGTGRGINYCLHAAFYESIKYLCLPSSTLVFIAHIQMWGPRSTCELVLRGFELLSGHSQVLESHRAFLPCPRWWVPALNLEGRELTMALMLASFHLQFHHACYVKTVTFYGLLSWDLWCSVLLKAPRGWYTLI